MQSRRVLGTVALAALATAAASFAVVDVSTSLVRACSDPEGACAHPAVSMTAVVFTVLGFLAIAVGAIPAVGWVVSTLARRQELEDEDEESVRAAARALRPAPASGDDDAATATSRITADPDPAPPPPRPPARRRRPGRPQP